MHRINIKKSLRSINKEYKTSRLSKIKQLKISNRNVLEGLFMLKVKRGAKLGETLFKQSLKVADFRKNPKVNLLSPVMT